MRILQNHTSLLLLIIVRQTFGADSIIIKSLVAYFLFWSLMAVRLILNSYLILVSSPPPFLLQPRLFWLATTLEWPKEVVQYKASGYVPACMCLGMPRRGGEREAVGEFGFLGYFIVL